MYVSVLIGARRGARLVVMVGGLFEAFSFSPHRCEAWGSADVVSEGTSTRRKVSVLIGARRGARHCGAISWGHRSCCVSVLIGARRGARRRNIQCGNWIFGSFSPHRCEAWGSARRCRSGFRYRCQFQSSSVRGVGLGPKRGIDHDLRSHVSVLIGARRGARPASEDNTKFRQLMFQSSSVRGVGLGSRSNLI